MPKIKILYTIPNFRTAGSQYVLLALYKGLDKNVFDPYVCVERFPESIPDDIPADRRLTFAFEGNTKNDLFRFKKLLKNHQIQWVHSWDYKSNFWEPLACRLSGVKYIYTKKNNAWSKRWFLKSVLANHIAYDNPEMKERFFGSPFLKKKICFIPHGVDTSVFKPVPALSRSVFNLVCIGNIGFNKNQWFLVKAMRQLPPQIHLHLFGLADQDYLHGLEKFITDKNLGVRIHIHDYVENKEIPNVLSNMDLFILPSLNEGLPVSILEALACGVPVLSSNSGGGAEFLLKQGGGYVFDLEAPKDFIAKIVTLSNQPEKMEMLSKQARNNVLKNFSIQNEIAAYERLYIELS